MPGPVLLQIVSGFVGPVAFPILSLWSLPCPDHSSAKAPLAPEDLKETIESEGEEEKDSKEEKGHTPKQVEAKESKRRDGDGAKERDSKENQEDKEDGICTASSSKYLVVLLLLHG